MLTDELMREVRRLQVRTKRRVEGLFAGEYHTAFKGRGIELADVREYEPGDDVRSIDWNVTARAGKTFIKRFIEERELTVILAVDLSSSGAFGTAGKTKARTAVELAAVLALAAATNNDRLRLLLFTGRASLFPGRRPSTAPSPAPAWTGSPSAPTARSCASWSGTLTCGSDDGERRPRHHLPGVRSHSGERRSTRDRAHDHPGPVDHHPHRRPR